MPSSPRSRRLCQLAICMLLVLAWSSAAVPAFAANLWTVTGNTLHDYSVALPLILLPSGKVMVSGATPESYDPVTNTWSAVAPPPSATKDGVVLQNGYVLFPSGPMNQL